MGLLKRGALLAGLCAALTARADVARDDYGAGALPRMIVDTGGPGAAAPSIPDRKAAQVTGGAEPASMGLVDLMLSLHGEEGRRLMLDNNFRNLLGLVRQLPQNQRTLESLTDASALHSAYVMERTTPTDRETLALVQKALANLSPAERASAVNGVTQAARVLDSLYGPAHGHDDPAVDKFVRIFDRDADALFPAGHKAPREQLANLRLELVARVIKDFSREIIPDLLEQKLRSAAQGLGMPPDAFDRAPIRRASEAILSGRTQGVINTDPRFDFAGGARNGPRGSFDDCVDRAKNQAAMLNCLIRAKTELDEPAFEWAARNLPRHQLPAAPGLPTPAFSVGDVAARAADRVYGPLGSRVPERSPSGNLMRNETDRLSAFLEENLDQIIDRLLGQVDRTALAGPGAAAARAELDQLRKNLESAGVREDFRRRLRVFIHDRKITQTADLLGALAESPHPGVAPANGERMILETVTDALHQKANQKLVAEILLTPAVGAQGVTALEATIDSPNGAGATAAPLTRALADRLRGTLDSLAPRPGENGEHYLTRLNSGGEISRSAARLTEPLLAEIGHQLDCVTESGQAPAGDPGCGTLDCDGILRDRAGHPLFSKEVSSLVRILRPAATDRVQDPLYQRTCRQSVHAVLDALPGVLADNDGQKFLDHPLAFFPKLLGAVKDARPRILDCVVAGSMDRVVLPVIKPVLAHVDISDGDAYEAFGGQRIYGKLVSDPAMQKDAAQLTDSLEAAVRGLAKENGSAETVVAQALRDFSRHAVERVLTDPHAYDALLTGVLTDPKIARLKGLQQDDEPDSSYFHAKNLLDSWIRTKRGYPLSRAQIAQVFARKPQEADALCREVMGPIVLFAGAAVDSSLAPPEPRPSGGPLGERGSAPACRAPVPLPFQKEPPASFRRRLAATSAEMLLDHFKCEDPDRDLRGANAIYDTVNHWMAVDEETRRNEQENLARESIAAGHSRDPANILAWITHFEKGFENLSLDIHDEDRRAEWRKHPATPTAAAATPPPASDQAAPTAQPAPAPAPG